MKVSSTALLLLLQGAAVVHGFAPVLFASTRHATRLQQDVTAAARDEQVTTEPLINIDLFLQDMERQADAMDQLINDSKSKTPKLRARATDTAKFDALAQQAAAAVAKFKDEASKLSEISRANAVAQTAAVHHHIPAFTGLAGLIAGALFVNPNMDYAGIPAAVSDVVQKASTTIVRDTIVENLMGNNNDLAMRIPFEEMKTSISSQVESAQIALDAKLVGIQATLPGKVDSVLEEIANAKNALLYNLQDTKSMTDAKLGSIQSTLPVHIDRVLTQIDDAKSALLYRLQDVQSMTDAKITSIQTTLPENVDRLLLQADDSKRALLYNLQDAAAVVDAKLQDIQHALPGQIEGLMAAAT